MSQVQIQYLKTNGIMLQSKLSNTECEERNNTSAGSIGQINLLYSHSGLHKDN